MKTSNPIAPIILITLIRWVYIYIHIYIYIYIIPERTSRGTMAVSYENIPSTAPEITNCNKT